MAKLIYLGLAGVLGYAAYLYSVGMAIGMPLKVAAGVMALLAFFAHRSTSQIALALSGKVPVYNDLKRKKR